MQVYLRRTKVPDRKIETKIKIAFKLIIFGEANLVREIRLTPSGIRINVKPGETKKDLTP